MESGQSETTTTTPTTKSKVLTIEPVILLFTIALNALTVTVQSYFVHIICLHRFQNGSGICSNLSAYEETERLVQEEAGDLATWRIFMEAGPPILFGLIWGQLNDNYGSKFLLLIPMFGFLTSSLLLLASTQISGIHPALLLLASVPSGCTGGAVALTISGLKYIVSMSKLSNRTFRLAMVELAVQVGQPIGTLLGAQITKRGGFSGLFLFTAGLEFASIIYLLFFVRNNSPETKKNILELDTLKEAFTVLFKKRPNRALVLVLVATVCLRTFSMNSIWAVSFFFTRLRFHWELAEYSVYVTVDGIVTAFGVMLASFLCIKILKMSNIKLAIPIAINQVVGTLIWSFASVSWLMYLGSAIQFAQGMISVIARSLLSQIVPSSEIGKAFSFVTIMESVIPIISGPFHLKLYVATLSVFPGGVYALNTLYSVVILLIFLWVRRATGKDPTLVEFQQELTEVPAGGVVSKPKETTMLDN